MSNKTIRKLSTEIKKNGFTYRQVKNDQNKYIYAQHNKTGKIVAYEVFLKKFGNLRKAKERFCALQNKSFNPEDYEELYETFPGDEEFGVRAWSCKTFEQAEVVFNSK